MRLTKISFLLVLLFLVFPVFSQTPTGTIQGVVTDPGGSTIAAAVVTITDTATNERHTVKTDTSGRYQVPFLAPGNYVVTVVAPGFRPATQTGLHVEVASSNTADFSMSVGQTTDQVQVSTNVEELDTTTSNLSDTIPARFILDLPDNGRNPFDFALLAPTVSNLGGASTPHIGGSRNGNNEQLIDGMTNILPENNVGNNVSAYNPIIDSVQEVNVQTSVLAAEYGRFSGGVVSLVTKSGGNAYHGSGYEFLETTGLNANAFGSAPDSKKTDTHRYQTGGTFSGPIRRDKTFFFLDFEDSRQSAGTSITSTVPQNLAAYIGGDFSGLGAPIYDPLTVHQGTYIDPSSGTTVTGYVRDQFPGNKIPTDRLSPIAQKILSYYPAPQTSAVTNNYVNSGANTNNYYHFDTKLDQQWNSNFHSFIRFSHSAGNNSYLQDYAGTSAIASPGGYNGPTSGNAYSLSFDNTVTFSSTLVGEFRYGFSKSVSNRTAYSAGFDPTTLGFNSGFDADAVEGLQFPHFGFNGFSDLGGLGYVPLLEDPLAHDVNGSLVKILGSHSVKVGGEFRYLYINFSQFAYPTGTFSADNTWTRFTPDSSTGAASATASAGGATLASFLLGLPQSGTIYDEPHLHQNSEYLAFFVQDDWKVRRDLTLNYGIRWDLEIPREERNNALSYWDPNATSALGSVAVPAGVTCPACGSLKGAMHLVNTPGAAHGRKQVPTNYNDFGPRIGFSYNPYPKMVLRGGFGIVFQPSAFQAAGTSGAPGIEGFTSQTQYNPSFDGQHSAPVASLANVFPGGIQKPAALDSTCLASPSCIQNIDVGNTISESYFDKTRNPYTMQWNLAVQYQLPSKIKAEVAYLGNRGLFLIAGDPGIPHDQLPLSDASLGNQLKASVTNPFYGIITTPGSALAQQTVQQNQLLRQYPQYTGVNTFRKPEADSIYHAFTVRVDREFSNGITFTTAFTGSKAIDDSASSVTYLGPAGATYGDQYNPRGERSVSPFDISRIFVASTVYELPYGRGKMFGANIPKTADLFLGGWQVNGILTYSGGTPFLTPSYDNGSTASGLLTFAQRPSLSGNPVGPGKSLNAAAFVAPAPFTIGNAPRTIPGVRNPSSNNLDFSAVKNTRWGDSSRYNAQFRFEMFNALNHENIGTISTSQNYFNSATGVTEIVHVNPNNGNYANSARVIQLGFKFYF
ncbi:hypothetical protein HDF16_002666 [Granulicella aggregans]|uniref:TonB-dependent transporter Oar-like beta-barrel domain-containing protein n=1 Tax=Granulicella aggregans TaxID=474949 RepID=A0A7W7ZDN3_9BACT|nr:carboxypeptidase-like regulatory domain-containing protein [Granulicella aggregans]MBB5057960.1 hypothetical protein [Granulicella aggregans]